MLSKILIATDCLVQCAAELKTLGLKEVILAHVVYVANEVARPGPRPRR